MAYSLIGASWGDQITERALIALAVFLALVALVIWAYFRNGKMAAAALIALGHDLILTIGIYALVGFTVTPATLIGVLTILGYSLYDTVVVFDKVRENVRDLKSSTTKTYSEAANLAVNQVLVRSINTTVIGVLPVAALLFAGAVDPGRGAAEGPGPGPVRRHGLRRVLLDLHRHAAARAAQGARAGHEEARRPGSRPAGPRTTQKPPAARSPRWPRLPKAAPSRRPVRAAAGRRTTGSTWSSRKAPSRADEGVSPPKTSGRGRRQRADRDHGSAG